MGGECRRRVVGCGEGNWKFKEMLIVIDIFVAAELESEPGQEFLLTTKTPKHHHLQVWGMQPVIVIFEFLRLWRRYVVNASFQYFLRCHGELLDLLIFCDNCNRVTFFVPFFLEAQIIHARYTITN